MDINLRAGNNSMKPLSFIWIAIFRDGSKIEQFNEDGSENSFKLVKDNFDNLAYFNLSDKKEHFFTVDLLNGLISHKFIGLPRIEKEEFKNNIRLIFFRRHRVEIGVCDLKEKKHTIEYHLGFQYNDKLGNNRQIVLIIDEKGSWILGE